MATKGFLVAALAATALLWGVAPPAPAETGGKLKLTCLPRAPLFDRLRTARGEVPRYVGATESGQLLEVLVGPGGSFAVFVSFADGVTCPLTVGDNWRPLRRSPGCREA